MSEMTVKTDDYPVIITREGNIHVLRIRELFLVERDRELSAGMERLEQRASALIDEQKALGDLGFLPPPGGVAKESRENRKLKIFAFKSALVALVLVIAMAAAAASFSYAIRKPMRHVGLTLGRSAINQIERGLQQAAEKEMTPQRREKIRKRVAEAEPFVKLYLAELRPLFSDICPPGQ